MPSAKIKTDTGDWQTIAVAGESGGSVAKDIRLARPHSKWAVGRYYTGHNDAALATGTAGAGNTLFLSPFYVPETVTIDSLALTVTTAAGASFLRLGIYEADQDTFVPTTLLVDAGAVSGAVATTVEASLSQQLQGNRVYLHAIGSTHAVGIRTIPVTSVTISLGHSYAGATSSESAFSWVGYGTVNAPLPTTVPSFTPISGGNLRALKMRVVSVP